MALLQSSKNPQALINQMANSNPQMKQVLDLVQNSGGDAKSLFYQMAKQKGIDPETILNQLR